MGVDGLLNCLHPDLLSEVVRPQQAEVVVSLSHTHTHTHSTTTPLLHRVLALQDSGILP